jgi:NADPH2 dehydrogenase
MTEEDMARVTEAFTDAAKRSLRIGFDAIELHFAHGYLLHSFVSPLSNRRNDAYGGSFEGRMRFPLEVVRSVRAAVPKSLPLGARITGTDWVEGGLTGDDAVAMGKALKAAGLDYVDISSANITPESRWPSEPGFNVPIAERVRRECGGLAVRAVGMIVSAKQAEEIIAQGKADMIAMARAFLDDPHWAWHAAQTLDADVARPPQYARTAPKLWPGAAMRG